MLIWFSLGFAAACGAGAYWLRGTGLASLLLLGAGMGCASVFLRKKWPFLGIAAAIFAGIAAGSGVFACYDRWYLEPAKKMDGQSCLVSVTAQDFSRETDYGYALDGTVTLEGKQYRVRLYLNEDRAVCPGDAVECTARLRFTDEGGRQEPTYHRTDGIVLLAYQEDELVLQPRAPRPWDQIAYLRRTVNRLISRCFPGDTEGFARALLLGDKTGLTDQISLDFRVTGLSHIVAVSGLHVSIFFALIYRLTGKRRMLTAMLGIPGVLLFAAVAGFTPSVTRAAVMQILMMLALVIRRDYDPPRALAFAVVGMLCVNPLVIASAGFQMSVASVAGIFLFYSRIYSRLGGSRTSGKKGMPARILNGILSSAALSLSATLTVTPLVAYHFGTVSLVGIAANLLVVWVVSWIFYGIILVCLLGLVHTGLGMALAWVVSLLIRYVLGAAAVLASLPLAAVYTESIYVVLWLVVCYGLILFAVITRPERIWPMVSLGAAALALGLILSWAEPLTDDYRVTVLDVGQGQCVLLQSRGNTFVVDCGGDSDTEAADRAAEVLLSMGISRIDGLILTHYDRDHAGGVPYLARRIDINRVYLPQTADTDGLERIVRSAVPEEAVVELDTDVEITMGSCTIRIFAPDSGKKDNESCAAVLFQNEKYDTLITGDMSAAGERRLLETGALPDLEILVVGHHGSAGSTSAELLYRTAPDAAFISVGRDNAYGHPRQEILARLRLYGCDIYRTDLMGDILFRG